MCTESSRLGLGAVADIRFWERSVDWGPSRFLSIWNWISEVDIHGVVHRGCLLFHVPCFYRITLILWVLAFKWDIQVMLVCLDPFTDLQHYCKLCAGRGRSASMGWTKWSYPCWGYILSKASIVFCVRESIGGTASCSQSHLAYVGFYVATSGWCFRKWSLCGLSRPFLFVPWRYSTCWHGALLIGPKVVQRTGS